MTDTERTAAEALYHALQLFPCTCQREFAYSGATVHECHRCKALAAWDAVRCEPLRAALAEGRVP